MSLDSIWPDEVSKDFTVPTHKDDFVAQREDPAIAWGARDAAGLRHKLDGRLHCRLRNIMRIDPAIGRDHKEPIADDEDPLVHQARGHAWRGAPIRPAELERRLDMRCYTVCEDMTVLGDDEDTIPVRHHPLIE